MMHKTSYQAFVFGAVVSGILFATVHAQASRAPQQVEQLPTVVIQAQRSTSTGSSASSSTEIVQLPPVVIVGKRVAPEASR